MLQLSPRFTERVSGRAEVGILVSVAPTVMLFSLRQKVKQPKELPPPPGYLGCLGREVHRREDGVRVELGGKWTQGKDFRWHISLGGSCFFLHGSYMGVFTLELHAVICALFCTYVTLLKKEFHIIQSWSPKVFLKFILILSHKQLSSASIQMVLNVTFKYI